MMAGATHAPTVAKFGEALREYNALRPANMVRFDYKCVPQMIKYAAKEYETACENHVVENISARVVKCFNLFFDNDLTQKFTAADRNKAQRYFMGRMTREGNADDEGPMWESFSKRVDVVTLFRVRAYIDKNLRDYNNLPLDVLGRPSVVKNRWWDYLRWLNDLQFHYEGHEARAFSILPLCSFTSKHVTIDTKILWGLMRRVSERTPRDRRTWPAAWNDFSSNDNKRRNWEVKFNLSKAEGTENLTGEEPPKEKRRDFEYIVTTDGYAVSVTLSKAKQFGPVFLRPPQVPVIDLAGKRVVGVDPGRIDLASCVYLRPEVDGEFSPPVFLHYSNKEYQEKIGLYKAHAKRRHWLAGAELQDQMTNLPSAKTPDPAMMIEHITALFLILDRVLALNGRRRVRDLRFSQHCRRQRVMGDICSRITSPVDEDDMRPVVVAFGAGMFSSSSRYHAPGPVKEVRTALRKRGVEVYDVEEDYTSQLCNSCHVKVVPMCQEGGRGEIYGVRRCTAAGCPRNIMNRDANAAMNILFIFKEESRTGHRPEVFTRVYQDEQNNIRRAALQHLPNRGV